jgi:hypothetical protein
MAAAIRPGAEVQSADPNPKRIVTQSAQKNGREAGPIEAAVGPHLCSRNNARQYGVIEYESGGRIGENRLPVLHKVDGSGMLKPDVPLLELRACDGYDRTHEQSVKNGANVLRRKVAGGGVVGGQKYFPSSHALRVLRGVSQHVPLLLQEGVECGCDEESSCCK